MDMLKALYKTIAFTLLLIFLLSCQGVHAEIKHYQYDGKLPFVQMMLNMMVAMGILDRIPVNGLYGSHGNPYSSWSRYSSPYTRALALRGLSPGTSSYFQNPYLANRNLGYGNNPYLRNRYLGYANNPYQNNRYYGYGSNPYLGNANSGYGRNPWSRSPWSQSGPLWGTPNWGVLPLQSYGNNYSPYGYRPYGHRPRGSAPNRYTTYGSPWDSLSWSSSDLSGWVNEPWETSTWNPRTENATQSSQSNLTLTTNNDLPDEAELQQPNDRQRSNQTPQQRTYNSSPLSKLVSPGDTDVQSNASSLVEQTSSSPDKPANGHSNNQVTLDVKEKPCVTDFCGLSKPNINGVWVAQNGEILGIKNQDFLWSDGHSQYLTGLIKIQNEYLLAYIDEYERSMRFKYKLAGDNLLTLQPDGTVREFTRLRTNPNLYQGLGYDGNYDGYYNYGSYY